MITLVDMYAIQMKEPPKIFVEEGGEKLKNVCHCCQSHVAAAAGAVTAAADREIDWSGWGRSTAGGQ